MSISKLTAQLAGSVKTIDDLMGAGEAILLSIVGRAASWGASVPNTVMVARSASEIFALSWGLSLTIAVSLELIGHALVSHWQDTREWNGAKNRSDQAANTALALGLVVGYFCLDLAMVGVLALSTYMTTSDWRIFIALCYPLIGVAVAVVTNERAHLFRLKQTVVQERQERSVRRNSRRKPRPVQVEPEPAGYTAIGGNTRARAQAILAERPGISGSELGRELGRSERLGRKLKTELVPETRGNGKGAR